MRAALAAGLALAMAGCQTPAAQEGAQWRCADGRTFATTGPQLRVMTVIVGERRVAMPLVAARTMTQQVRMERYEGEGLALVRNVRVEAPFTMHASLIGMPDGPYENCVRERN